LLWTFPQEHAIPFALKAFFDYPLSKSSLAFIPGILQEKGFLLSPIVLVGTIASFFVAFMIVKKKSQSTIKMVLIAIYLILLTFFFAQAVSGNGIFAHILHSLPILSSQRVFIRFLYIPSLLLTVLAIVSLQQITNTHIPRHRGKVPAILAMITILTFYLGHSPAISKHETLFNYDPAIKRSYHEHLNTMEELSKSDNLPKPVSTVKHGRANFTGSTGLECGDSLLLWAGPSALHYQALQPGPITNQQNGFYNIIKPACYIFPKANNCSPGDKIPITDQKNLIDFTSSKKVTWSVPLYQKILNWLSFTWLVISLLTIFIISIRDIKKMSARLT